MLPVTALDSINLALDHTKLQLFRPFRLGQWTRLAFVGLLAGELGSSGFNGSNFHVPHHPGTSSPHLPSGIEPFMLAVLITAAIVAAIAIGIIFMFISSVMRFILFDSVVERECHIRRGWSRRLGPGWRYFVWTLLYLLLTTVALFVVIGVPVAFAFIKGWFREPKAHMAPLILGGMFVLFVLAAYVVLSSLILVLTKDFVVPQMALENIDVMEGWRRLWWMMKAEKGAYAGYVIMKIVLAIVAAILMGIATLFLGLIIAIPSLGLGLLAVLTGKSAGLTWNAETITLAVVVGCVLFAIFLYLASMIYVPAIVFFPAYSIHFFAGRYPRLSAILYPTPSPPSVPPSAQAASI